MDSPFCRSVRRMMFHLTWLIGWLGLAIAAGAAEINLQDIQFTTLPGDQLRMRFVLDGSAEAPKVFQTDNPARLVLDFDGVRNAMGEKRIPVNTGVVTEVNAVQGNGRTRLVVNLVSMVPYDLETEGNEVRLTLKDAGAIATTETPSRVSGMPDQRIEKIDFRRGPGGEGRILVFLKDPNTLVDLRQEGGKVVASFLNTRLPSRLAKKLDVLDFATPVESIEASSDGRKTQLVITPANSNYDYLSYQSDRLLTIEFRPLTRAEKEEIKKKKFPYTGDRLSLNFQDIPVRSVLKILTEFTGLNIIAADSVKGNVTLGLNNVPWDQALDLVLKAKGLGKRKEGNIIWVAPLDEIIKQEKKELEHVSFREKTEPLRTEIIQLNYAKAVDVLKVLKGMQKSRIQKRSQSGQNQSVSHYASNFKEEVISKEKVAGGSVLSERGEVNIDERTNILIVKDTPHNLEAVRRLVQTLDRPVRQVLIESRVVIANDDFTRDLGVRLNAAKRGGNQSDGTQTLLGGVLGNNNGIVDLPAAIGTGAGGGMGIAIFKLNRFLMQLELSALQNENRGEIVSMPKVVTQDQTEAVIEQGEEIPFQSVSQNGTQTQFKEAVLKLQVTPHITPDDNVIMDLQVTKDARGEVTPDGQIAIDKREIQTTVQVANGETVVLGGIYEQEKSKTVNKLPFFGDLPGLGFLFRRDQKIDQKRELLVFITPKVLKEATAMR
ncbi:type IV pilus secretin PilQ [Methylohalobius crimeensis]|uniref:type IV pilus secretin PilQ n=1 Tax=Methylohalobius crimeensis TaxID=244365 RepID=UPI00047D8CF3|nr:type IV pilus secretin PilQ [Methylohalobius crimeensis]